MPTPTSPTCAGQSSSWHRRPPLRDPCATSLAACHCAWRGWTRPGTTLAYCWAPTPPGAIRRRRRRRDPQGGLVRVHPPERRRRLMTDPIDEFIAGLLRLGAEPERHGGLVVYRVEPVGGGSPARWSRRRSRPSSWWHGRSRRRLGAPQASVSFARTNSQASILPGWVRRPQLAGWGGDADPVQGWLAHLRAVVGEAR